MKRKIVSILLVGACVAGLLGGCGQNAPTQDASVNGAEGASGQALLDENGRYLEEVTITGVLSHSQPQSPDQLPPDTTPENFSFIQGVKDELNINFEWLWTAPTEQFAEKFGVAMASGDLPDIMKVSTADYETLKENGQLADLSGTLQYASEEVSKYLQEDPTILESLTTEDGKLYTIPQYYDVRREMNMLYIRQDWLDELGLEVPKTTEELETVMKAFQEKTGAPQAIALSGKVNDWGLDVKGILNMFGAAPYSWIDKGDGTLVPGEIQPEAKSGLETIAKWYQEGYINREFVSMDVDKAKESVVAGETGILLGPWWMYENAVILSMQKDPAARWTTAAIPSNGNGKAMVPRKSIASYYVVNSSCEHPEALMLLINSNVRGHLEDVKWRQPENGYVWNWDPAVYNDPYDIQSTFEKFQAALEEDPKAEGPAPESFTDEEKKYWDMMDEYLLYKEGDSSVLNDNNVGTFGNIIARIDADGGWGSVEEISASSDFIYNEFYGSATDTMKTKSATLEKLVEETYLKIIMGELPVSEFDTFVENWKSLGGDEITQEVNDWYDQQKAGQ